MDRNIDYFSEVVFDAPDYSDACIISADYDGIPLSEAELVELNDDIEMVYELSMLQI